jgi:rubrerythrin
MTEQQEAVHTLICIDCGAEYRGTPNDCPHCGERTGR